MRHLFYSALLLCLYACSTTEIKQAPTAANIVAAVNTKTVFTCGATTKNGTQCKRTVKTQGATCFQHDTIVSTAANVQCEGITKAGQRCKNKSKNAFCHLHTK